nr:multidrug resistance regulator 2 [Quercus suber]
METSSPSYSCDACYSRKIACSRETPRCSRCAQAEVNCVYSRKGKIRRSVRHGRSATTQHDHDISLSSKVNLDHRKQSASSDAVLPASAPTPALSSATTTQERLEQFSGSSTHHATFAKLASLLEEYRAAHRSSDAFDVLADEPIKECLGFDDNAAVSVWVDGKRPCPHVIELDVIDLI